MQFYCIMVCNRCCGACMVLVLIANFSRAACAAMSCIAHLAHLGA